MNLIARHVTRTVMALAAFTLLGVGGLIFAELVPDRWVIDALEDAERNGGLDATERSIDAAGTQVDEFTDCITLSVGLGETADQGLLETVALAPHLGPCSRLVDHLNPYDGARAAAARDTYLRYWHGASPIVRPVLAAFGLPGLRAVNLLAIAVAGAALAGVVRHRVGSAAAVGLIGPYVLTTSILSLPGATNQALAFAAGVGMAAFAGTIAAGGLTGPRVWYPSLAAGAVFVYVDLLTVVPGMWLLTAAVVAAIAYADGRNAVTIAGWSLLSGTAWFVGYAGMWCGKWLFAAAVLGRQRVVDVVTDTIQERVSGESPWSEPGLGNAIDANLDVFTARPFVGSLLAVAVVAAVVRVARSDAGDLTARAAVAAAVLVLPVWYEIASNHSQVHAWFTYRSLPVALGVVLMALLARRPTVSEPDSNSAAN